MTHKTYKKNNGFTLIEIVVALAVFSMVIIAVTDIFLNGWGGVQRIAGQQNIQSAGRFFMESIAKEIRMSTINTANGGPYATVNITNAKGETIDYTFNNSAKQISRAGSTLSSDEIEVTGHFYVQKNGSLQPRVTITMSLKNKTAKAAQQSQIDLQTTISSRSYD